MSIAFDSDVDPHTCRDPKCRECGPAADEAADERDERARAAESAALAWDEPDDLPEHGDEDWQDPAAGLRVAS